MNAKVTDLPESVVGILTDKAEQESETLLREFAQTLLNNLLLRLDLAPLRAERALYGSLGDHFVVPAFRERKANAETVVQEGVILKELAEPGARRIVHGGAGVGKTTWSLWIQSRLLQSELRRLCVVLRLREYTRIENQSLLELMQERAGTHLRDAISHTIIRRWCDKGRLVVILDGFDEISEERRDAVEKWIKDLSASSKRAAIVVTSRPLQSGHLESLSKPWQQWDLLPFDESRIVDFIERWHRYLPEGELSPEERQVDAKSLARIFFNDPSLRPLADTPLMLGTLLFVHHRDKKLPSGRVDLYERYIAAMLGLRDSGLGIQARATKLTDKEKRRVLAHVALHFHLNSINEVNDDTMRNLVEEALAKFRYAEKVERLLPALCERTGLLQGPGAWSFMHKTIAEFLVAELVCEGTTRLPDKRRLDRKELWAHRQEDTWTAVMFFWAGKTSPRELEEFVSDMLDEPSELRVLLALALMHDQGDRFTHETQRAMALRIIKKAIPENSPNASAVSDMIVVPPFVFAEGPRSSIFELRGLSKINSVGALSKFLARGLLVPSDLDICHETFRAQLTVACFWALSDLDSSLTFDIRHHLKNFPKRDLALNCFSSGCFNVWLNTRTSLLICQQKLSDWLSAFPEGRSWVPLLLPACVSYADLSPYSRVADITKRVGPMMWEWRSEPVDDDWLRESDICRGERMNERDVLIDSRRELLNLGADAWGLSVERHSELLAWCDHMMARRKQLKQHSPNKQV